MTDSKPGPAYFIRSERLVIRCWQPADAALLKSAIDANIEHLQPWLPWADQEPTSLDEKIELLRRFRGEFDLGEDYVYGIFDLSEARVLGGTGFHARIGEGGLEIGYWIHHEYTNRGLATESAAALTRVAFEVHQIARVEIHCDPENVRSAAIPRKLGYELEATLKNRVQVSSGEWRDSMIWTLLADDYPGSRCAQIQIEARDAFGRQIL